LIILDSRTQGNDVLVSLLYYAKLSICTKKADKEGKILGAQQQNKDFSLRWK